MNASEYFKHIVKPNYEDAVCNSTDLRILWNAVVSMNTVPEFIALHRLAFSSTAQRADIDRQALAIRQKYPVFQEIKDCAEALKHVRKHRGQTMIATSTDISINDPTTWDIPIGSGSKNLVSILTLAFTTSQKLPELN